MNQLIVITPSRRRARAPGGPTGATGALPRLSAMRAGLEAMPATPGTAARFLSFQTDSGRKASTIGRRAAAIA
jgi:hypothetical protein